MPRTIPIVVLLFVVSACGSPRTHVDEPVAHPAPSRRAPPAVEGICINEQGKPVPSATVALNAYLRVESEDPDDPVDITRADSSGRFSFRTAAAGDYAVTATAPGVVAGYLPDVHVAGSPLQVVIKMGGPGIELRGEVSGLDGKPLANARVRAIRFSNKTGDVFATEADESGSYSLNLPEARYLVAAQAGEERIEKHYTSGGSAHLDLRAGDSDAARWAREVNVPLAMDGGTWSGPRDEIGRLAEGASIVLLGEVSHGSHDIAELRFGLARQIIALGGARFVAVEAPFGDLDGLDAYVRGAVIDPVKALGHQTFWIVETDELLDFARWLRGFNDKLSPENRVGIVGIDVQFPARACADLASLLVRNGKSDAALPLRPLCNTVDAIHFFGRNEAEHEAAIAAVERLPSLLARLRLPAKQWETQRALRAAVVLREFVAFATHMEQLGRIRNAAMAANIAWLADLAPKGRVIVLAHNAHVSRVPDEEMGAQLAKLKPGVTRVIATTFLDGEVRTLQAKTPVQGQLHVYRMPKYPLGGFESVASSIGTLGGIVDFRRLPPEGPVASWFAEAHTIRSIGAVYDPLFPNAYFVVRVLPVAYDAVVFINKSTPVHTRVAPDDRFVPLQEKAASLSMKDVGQGDAPIGWAQDPKALHGAGLSHASDGPLVVTSHPSEYGTDHNGVVQRIAAKDYVGKVVRVRAHVRLQSKGTDARIWLDADSGAVGTFGTAAYGEARTRPNSLDQQELAADVAIPPGVDTFMLGCSVVGEGVAAFEQFDLETQ